MHELDRYLKQPARLNGIKFVAGRTDVFNPIETVRAFDKAMTDLGIKHEYKRLYWK